MVSRFRLIPTRTARGGRFIFGSPLDALVQAQELSDDREMPVLIVEHPEGGTIRPLSTVNGSDTKRSVKR